MSDTSILLNYGVKDLTFKEDKFASLVLHFDPRRKKCSIVEDMFKDKSFPFPYAVTAKADPCLYKYWNFICRTHHCLGAPVDI